MIARRSPARGLAALLLLCLLLGGVLALEMRYPEPLVLRVGMPGDGGPVAAGSNSGGGDEPDRYRPPGETDFAIIEQRPLFSPERRPPDIESGTIEEGPAPPSSLDGLALTGIIRAGEERVAIVEPVGPPRPGNEPVSLRVGDKLRGWKVLEIATDRMVLENSTQRFEMVLIDDPARRRARPRPPAAAPPNPRAANPFQPQQQPQLQPQLQPQPQPQPQPQRQ